MKYEKRIVCYFDILGFSSKVCNKTIDVVEIEKLFNDISSIINDYPQDRITISYFSDSFVVSIFYRTAAPTQLEFIIDALEKLLEYKLIARGAMVYGEVRHTDKNVYGPAMVKAVHLEKYAKYPRLILDESLDELPLPTFGNESITYRSFFNDYKYVKTDSVDGQFYIDLLGELKKKKKLDKHKSILESLISNGLQDDNLFENSHG
ncbi:MAG: hypothetical protein H7282_09300 [Cytophagaceae bacterium]|nr:hypothetical protein [Cytophagaceae bacterium]